MTTRAELANVNNLLAFQRNILINGSCEAGATLTHANARHIRPNE